MQIIDTPQEWLALRKTLNQSTPSASIGLVATMGNLHEGHCSLIEKSAAQNTHTVLSIFVNPTQFNDSSDFARYPKTLEADLDMAQNAGVQTVFLPTKELLYPDDYRYQVHETSLSQILEGVHRLGHFNGMLTVVLKLFNIIKPHRAYFGEKDRQQLLLIQGMVEALFLDLEIVPCSIVRQPDGLALSSRNQFLEKEDLLKAVTFANILKKKQPVSATLAELQSVAEVDYVADYDTFRLGAAKIGKVRLIDNYSLEELEEL